MTSVLGRKSPPCKKTENTFCWITPLLSWRIFYHLCVHYFSPFQCDVRFTYVNCGHIVAFILRPRLSRVLCFSNTCWRHSSMDFIWYLISCSSWEVERRFLLSSHFYLLIWVSFFYVLQTLKFHYVQRNYFSLPFNLLCGGYILIT